MSLCASWYARVSSEQQAQAETIGSQIAALEQQVKQDGVSVPEDLRFIDDGYSGATLIRPALERLRDALAAGLIDRLYVHSPDRLARKYAYQVLLIEECQRAGVEVVFLNHPLGQSPEEQLLLQMQGMIAEYERAKILERSRRGKRHAAQQGAVSVLSGAPYGYRYVSKHEGEGEARYEIEPESATVVQQVFRWVGQQRLTIGEVARRLQQQSIPSPTGKSYWDRSTIWGMLTHPAYKGRAVFGKTKVGPRRSRLRAQRNGGEHPRRAYSTYDTTPEEQTAIAVPALVDEALHTLVQEQLAENRQQARQRARGARYLLQGLVVCGGCGYAYYGKPVSRRSAKGKPKHYTYYRCIGTDAYRFGGQRVCENKPVRTDLLETAVWSEIKALLADPRRVEAEYHRRLATLNELPEQDDIRRLEQQLSQLQKGISRLIDSYVEGVIDKADFEPKVKRLKERANRLQEQQETVRQSVSTQQELKLIVGRLEEFADKVQNNLDQADWETRRALIRALVKRIEIHQEEVNVVFRVEPGTPPLTPEAQSLQHCRGRDYPALR